MLLARNEKNTNKTESEDYWKADIEVEKIEMDN